MTDVKKKPLVHLDILRIYAAFCVILLHVISPLHGNLSLYGTPLWHTVNVLNAFARTGVPIFLMLTGCLLLPSPAVAEFGRFYRRRLSRILIPFFIWDLLYYAAGCLSSGRPILLRGFLDELLVRGSAYHLWYVYTLAGIYLLLPFLSRALSGCTNRQIFWLALLAAFPGAIRPLINLTTPLAIHLFDPLLEGYLGYVILGYWLSRIPLNRLTAWAIPVCGLGGLAMGVLFNFFRSSPEGLDLYFNGGYNLNHYLLAAAIFLAARHLRLPDVPRLWAILHRISGLTYTVYLAHVMVLELLSRLLPLNGYAAEIVLHSTLCFLIALVLAFLLDWGKKACLRLLSHRKEGTA